MSYGKPQLPEAREQGRHHDLTALLSRRQLLAGMGGVAAAAALAGCGSGGSIPAPGTLPDAGPPRRGGDFRLGIIGGGATDTIDGQIALLPIDAARSFTAFETLSSLDNNFAVTNDGLAESVEADSPTQYTIRLRQGIEFHNGKTMSADDVIYSFQRVGSDVRLNGHVASATMDLAGIKKLDPLTVRLPLKTPDSTVPLNLAAPFYFGIVPEGYERYKDDASTQIGTGPYKLSSFTPGQQSVSVRNENYWREGQPYFDTVTIIDFNDVTAQVNALLGGQIDAMTELPAGLVKAVQSRGVNVLESPSGLFLAIAMMVDKPPFDDVRVRQAFRLIVDRQVMLEQIGSKYGVLGNDMYSILDPVYAKDLPQRSPDIAKAKELLKAAGHQNLTIDLPTTPGMAGQVAIATVFAQQAKKAGVTVNVRNIPGDQYWTETWMKVPIYTTTGLAKPYLIQTQQTGLRKSTWPELSWPPDSGPGSKFDDLYRQAVSLQGPESEPVQKEMQRLQYDYGGYIIPFFPSTLDAYASNVGGLAPAKTTYGMNNFGRGFRTMWFGREPA